jgi:RIO kinase 1
MRIPDSLESLVSEGIITEVVRPLMSGKEAQVYLVESGGELRVAKIYKDAINRSFKHRAEYTEGRGTRSSRDARAIQKRSKYGRAMDEEAWRSAEVDVIYRLRSAGVRVPEPFQFVDGVLIMELVKDAYGDPAPRLGDVDLGPVEARRVFDQLLRETVRMLCADVVHGDLSSFNVLIDAAGPVIIDFPQSVDASKNQTARELLVRDVDNLTHFLSRYEPAMRNRPYGQEIWAAYETNELTPDTVLTGTWRPAQREVNTNAMLDELAEVEFDEVRRRASRGLAPLGKKGSSPTGRPPMTTGGARPAQAQGLAGRGPAPRGHGGRDQGGRNPAAQGHGGRDQLARGHGAPVQARGHGGRDQSAPVQAARNQAASGQTARDQGGRSHAGRGQAAPGQAARGPGPREQPRPGPRHGRPQEQRAPVVERGRVAGQQLRAHAAVNVASTGGDPRRDQRPQLGGEVRGDGQRSDASRGDTPRGDGPPPRRRRRRRGGGGGPSPKVWTPS